MSVTGSRRSALDFYPTPLTAIYSFLDNYDGIKPEDRILEPSAGTGNVVKALRNHGYENRIDSVEINPSRKEVLEECSDSVVIADFLELPVKQTYEVVLGNPPYSLAQEFVDKSLEFLVPGGHLIFLLRTCFSGEPETVSLVAGKITKWTLHSEQKTEFYWLRYRCQ